MNRFFNPKMMIQQMINSNPQARQAWVTAQKLSNGKNDEEKRQIIENLAKERNISTEQLREMAMQFGIKL